MTGPEFKRWVEDNGWTRERLAKALGVGRRSIHRWQLKGTPKFVELALKALERKEEGK